MEVIVSSFSIILIFTLGMFMFICLCLYLCVRIADGPSMTDVKLVMVTTESAWKSIMGMDTPGSYAMEYYVSGGMG